MSVILTKLNLPGSLRPYRAAFASRFIVLLQYRAAALAGFFTQCWWGGTRVMVLSAFYRSTALTNPPMSLHQAITYIWLAQAWLVLLPWSGDPEVATAMRSGAICFDRLRPVDTYFYWFARGAGWILARALPRAALMFGFAGVVLPLLGLSDWAWQAPPTFAAGCLSLVALVLAVGLASTFILLINIAVVRTLSERGVNALVAPLVVVFSGNLLPLALLPDWLQPFLLVQPFAGLLDIPVRIYFGQMQGAGAAFGLALQLGWMLAFVLLGRISLTRTMRTLEVQGG